MSDPTSLLYLEADDEITAVVRRVRAADAGRVVIVAPGRSRATSSAVALRLLARTAAADGREIAVVGDELTRSLATEAGVAAYRSVEEARSATPLPPAERSEAPSAAIHVVRGQAADDATVAAPVLHDTETRAVEHLRPARRAPPSRRPPRPRPRRRPIPLFAVLGAAAALLVIATVAGATLLPAASIEIAPRSEPIGPVAYRITIDDPESVSGTVTETATVTATGTYPVQAPATGSVVLLNWTFFPVTVPAGTFVAAGEQAFATQAEVVVPRGRLTGGFITAGQIEVAVSAAAVGPAANVPEHAIDTIVDEEIDQRLRGFPENTERRVDNPAATTGGVDTTGHEFSQADVDAALGSLREALSAAVADALGASGETLHADPVEPVEPAITGVDGLVGTRDQEQAEISGELAYDRLTVDAAEVEDRARERFASDEGVVPDGQDLLDDSVSVTIGTVERSGTALIVDVEVSARAAPRLDRAAIIERVVGLPRAEAEAALAPLGRSSVELWPGWVTSVPEGEWRIDVVITGVENPLPLPSGS